MAQTYSLFRHIMGHLGARECVSTASGRMGLGKLASPTDHGGYGGTLEISGAGGALYLKSGSDVGQYLE